MAAWGATANRPGRVWTLGVLGRRASRRSQSVKVDEVPSPQPLPSRATIVVCFSDADAKLKSQLMVHLGALQHLGRIDLWSADSLVPGQVQSAELEQRLIDAKVALLLISPTFLVSSFIAEGDSAKILKRRVANGLMVVPLILRDCVWREHPLLRQLKPLPRDGTPIAKLPGHRRDEALRKIALAVARIAEGVPHGRSSREVEEEPVNTNSRAPTSSIKLHVVASFSLLGAVAGITLEITQAGTLFFLAGLAVFFLLALGWALHAAMSSAKALSAGATKVALGATTTGEGMGIGAAGATHVSSLAIGGGVAGLAGGTTSVSGTIALATAASLTVATGAGIGGAQTVAAISNRPATWQQAMGLGRKDSVVVAPSTPGTSNPVATVAGPAVGLTPPPGVTVPEGVSSAAPLPSQEEVGPTPPVTATTPSLPEAGACAHTDEACSSKLACCDSTHTCQNGSCRRIAGASDQIPLDCALAGQRCGLLFDNCCSNLSCVADLCVPCTPAGLHCDGGQHCCGSIPCAEGVCRCLVSGDTCTFSSQCCTGVCGSDKRCAVGDIVPR